MAATELTEKFVGEGNNRRFADSAAIDAFFVATVGSGFIDWFNAKLAGKGAWISKRKDKQGRVIVDPVRIGAPAGISLATLKQRFAEFWDKGDEVFGAPPTLTQFIALMSIFINEVRGYLVSQTEFYGSSIAYLFDAKGKLSYNFNPGKPQDNIPAGKLFHDPIFVAAHKHRALGDRLANKADPVPWNGNVYSATGFPTRGPTVEKGFIAEADFMKFRGRGLIQTTWRSNYRGLVEFVQAYDGATPALRSVSARWRGTDPNRICTESSNEDWDALFGDRGLEIVLEALRQHSARGGDYLKLAGTAAGLNAVAKPKTDVKKVRGSIWYMGRMISGSPTYADTYRTRVVEICNALGNGA